MGWEWKSYLKPLSFMIIKLIPGFGKFIWGSPVKPRCPQLARMAQKKNANFSFCLLWCVCLARKGRFILNLFIFTTVVLLSCCDLKSSPLVQFTCSGDWVHSRICELYLRPYWPKLVCLTKKTRTLQLCLVLLCYLLSLFDIQYYLIIFVKKDTRSVRFYKAYNLGKDGHPLYE